VFADERARSPLAAHFDITETGGVGRRLGDGTGAGEFGTAI
jgi:hypothetical protein